ncbi:MAG TPA: serine/threonine-protein kinase [Solirubrobacteraceae bacterium]
MATTATAHGTDGERGKLAAVLPAYEIGAVLGRGAFAIVYSGRHRRLDREVAIKRLSTELLAEEAARDRFAVEARLLASLDHPHIVRVYDYVEEGEVCALVMERLHGGTLADRLRLGRLPHATACAITLAALHGLEYAHRRGVLHRDVKPENLLFGEHRLLKVGDFGIAKVVGAHGARLTATATGIGTPAFMAPEQVSRSAGPLSSATDIWAVGAVLYEMLAGAPPFPTDGEVGEILVARVTEDPRPLSEPAPDAPKAIAEVVMRALRRRPDERYQTAAAFAEALERAANRALGTRTIAATRIPLHPNPPPADATAAPLLVEPAEADLAPAPDRRRRRRRLGAAIAAVAAAAVVAVVLMVAGGGSPRRGADLASLPGPPPGWPRALSLGADDTVGGPAGVARRVGRGGLSVSVFAGDAAKGDDWSSDPKQSPAAFVRNAGRRSLFPYAMYYQLRAVGRGGRDADNAGEIRRTLADSRLMRIYWRNARAFLRSLGSTGRPVAVSLESGFWALLEQDLGFKDERPDSVHAVVGSSGLRELRGLPDHLPGFASAWQRLRDRYAPRVLIGYDLDDYGTNLDISKELVPRPTVVARAREAGTFFLQIDSFFDFGALEIAFSEEGRNPTRKEVYSTAEKDELVEFVREFTRVSRFPVVLENVPVGNTVMRTIDDRPYHWRDSWVQWMLGDDRSSGLRKLRDAGVIGVYFGVFAAATDRTCPCDAAHDGVTNRGRRGATATSADDDGGYFRARVEALRRAGGLALR